MSNDPQSRVSQNFMTENNVGGREGRQSSSNLHMGRKRRRFLVVPQTESDLSFLQDAYCDADDGDRKEGLREIDGQVGASDQQKMTIFDTSASSSSQTRSYRPLPSTQNLALMIKERTDTRDSDLASTSSSAPKTSPLLLNFYKSIGLKGPLEESTSESVPTDGLAKEVDSENKKRESVDEIDDPSLSTLKMGHHKRYLQLTTSKNTKNQHTSKLTFVQRKELGKLQQLISKEQDLYRSALDKFHETYKSRYLIGFESKLSGESTNNGKSTTASAFCRWACFHAQSINREWEERIDSEADWVEIKSAQRLPKYYGKVMQTIALHHRTQQSSLDVQDLTCSVVHESKPIIQQSSSPPSSSSPLPPAKLKEVVPKDIGHGTTFQKISPPTKDSVPSVRLLRDDWKAIELARHYSAAIITTSETLETLLRLPGHHSSKWMLPCTTETLYDSPERGLDSVTILDLPIAQAFNSPRSCLEMGLQEGVYQAFLKQRKSSQVVETSAALQNKEEKQEETSPFVNQFVYSLWTLPRKSAGGAGSSRKPTRVLVRTLVRLRDSISKLPVRIRARVEYFFTPVGSESRSRREIPNSYEKSLWILDQVLFGHQVFGLQYRIDPTTCEIVGWDTTSVAHALAASETVGIQSDSKSHSSSPSPLDHWEALIQLMQSIPSIDKHHTLLCLPGLISERKNIAKDKKRENALGEGEISTAPTTNNQQEQVRLDPYSVSVHVSPLNLWGKHESTGAETSTPGTIGLGKSVLDQAGAVILGDQAIRDCRRDWEWDRAGQVPNTFPVAVDTIE